MPKKMVTRYVPSSAKGDALLAELPNGASPSGDFLDSVIEGNALAELQKMPANLVDLIVSSPPYADSRKRTYGGIHPDDYVQWFLPFADKLYSVLKPSGSVILNIKEKVVGRERQPQVLRLIFGKRRGRGRWDQAAIL